MKKYPYTDAAGTHFPDANKGDQMYYAVDLAGYIELESELITKVNWLLPKEVILADSYMVDGKEAAAKLSTPIPGVYRVVLEVTSIDTGKEQINKIPLVLKVV